MNRGEISSSDGMSDSNLDRILAEANQDLLAHIEAAADPIPALTAVMARATTAALVIEVRSAVRRLVGSLDRARVHVRAIDRALNLVHTRGRARTLDNARARALDLTFALDGARALDLDCVLDLDYARIDDRTAGLTFYLDRARGGAQDVVRVLARDNALDRGRVHDVERALDRVRDIERALDRARALDHELSTQHVDASGVDLSDVTIEDMDVLDGVIWSSQTTWPPRLGDQVRMCSREIGAGIYQVERGNDPDRFTLAGI